MQVVIGAAGTDMHKAVALVWKWEVECVALLKAAKRLDYPFPVPAYPIRRSPSPSSMQAQSMNAKPTTHPEIWLIRHGETKWSLSGQHTGRTDIPLTDNGCAQASALKPVLARQHFDHVLCSPLVRAQDTCKLAGLASQMKLEPRLMEWNYGIYEGRKTQEIREEVPDWSVWDSPMPNGEDVTAVQQRAESLIDHLLTLEGRVALFAHAHILRVLAGCWMADDARLGAHLVLGTASISKLGFDRDYRAITQWNQMPA